MTIHPTTSNTQPEEATMLIRPALFLFISFVISACSGSMITEGGSPPDVTLISADTAGGGYDVGFSPPDAGFDATPDTSDAGSDTTLDVADVADTTDVEDAFADVVDATDTTPDVIEDVVPDVVEDTSPDTTDAGFDSSPEVSVDATPDAEPDVPAVSTVVTIRAIGGHFYDGCTGTETAEGLPSCVWVEDDPSYTSAVYDPALGQVALLVLRSPGGGYPLSVDNCETGEFSLIGTTLEEVFEEPELVEDRCTGWCDDGGEQLRCD